MNRKGSKYPKLDEEKGGPSWAAVKEPGFKLRDYSGGTILITMYTHFGIKIHIYTHIYLRE